MDNTFPYENVKKGGGGYPKAPPKGAHQVARAMSARQVNPILRLDKHAVGLKESGQPNREPPAGQPGILPASSGKTTANELREGCPC